MNILTRLLVIIGTIVILAFVPASQRLEAIEGGCGLVSCSGGYCLWDPDWDLPCEQGVGPNFSCVCSLHGNCSVFFSWIEPLHSRKYFTTDDRPEGTCEEIPCGNCWEVCDQECMKVWKCLNPDLGYPCDQSQFPSVCDVRFLEFIYVSSLQKTGARCCYDIY